MQVKEPPSPEELRQTAATRIQAFARGMLARIHQKRDLAREYAFLGMVPKVCMPMTHLSGSRQATTCLPSKSIAVTSKAISGGDFINAFALLRDVQTHRSVCCERTR